MLILTFWHTLGIIILNNRWKVAPYGNASYKVSLSGVCHTVTLAFASGEGQHHLQECSCEVPLRYKIPCRHILAAAKSEKCDESRRRGSTPVRAERV